MFFMIVEHFKNDDPLPVYRRFRDCGRLAPDGLQYISSWVDENLGGRREGRSAPAMMRYNRISLRSGAPRGAACGPVA
jgi:hypothetical protein